ncbi:YgaP family membrane protein [Robertkochia aurantiaca]|uniref:YgaP family membrane protein n=1 Tax=Robertkochia aurantiaca TaxID=2873700 RepID=UPI001CCB61FA
MKKNMSQQDKLIRVVISFIIAVLYYYNIISGIMGIVLMVGAIILLLTSLFRFCPIYKLIGYSSCKK